jgi:hypothetical protein
MKEDLRILIAALLLSLSHAYQIISFEQQDDLRVLMDRYCTQPLVILVDDEYYVVHYRSVGQDALNYLRGVEPEYNKT